MVVGERDGIILKSIAAPAMEDFDEFVARARNAARKAGMKRADLRRAVAKARTGR